MVINFPLFAVIVSSIGFVFTLIGSFLLFNTRIRYQKRRVYNPPKVSIIIPARNEEKRITPLLKSLSTQLSQGIEIILVDDQSTDKTAEIAKEFGVKVITALPLPKGWFGKPWACYQGAQAATGDVYVFLDADTYFSKDGFSKLMDIYGIDQTPLSVQPYHQVKKFYEHFSLFFNLIVMMTSAQFTPIKAIKAQSFFGPCQVMSKEDYWMIDGHACAKHAILEDVVIGQQLSLKTGKNIRALSGKGLISFRMYSEGFQSLKEGWMKNFATGAKLIKPWMLVMISFWITGMFVNALSGIAPFMWQFYLYPITYGVTAFLIWLNARKVGQFSLVYTFVYPVFLVFFVYLFVVSSNRLKHNKTVAWKGRDLQL
jgi:4,4'-diaponeurosporenoate glycosyltransferase